MTPRVTTPQEMRELIRVDIERLVPAIRAALNTEKK